ncbi:DUF6894 family protein [Rhizobium rosettiformans]|uniref:DUF6894 family protein n=1 Tax=Rhizobium rosettiformans TaxID=1368430 RepID=UPI00285B376F|nr:hypothetical protein [Rhizobium rosettiformans]MDR7027262.1 hypothetical protein [Rhizobium rosettiformans]MDR7065383.1 hypothetical protein [Rhizobium rosettiformans]
MFYFNIRTEVCTIPDVDGILMPSASHAIREAKLAAREMVVEAVMRETAIDGTTIEVRDDAGNIVEAVPLISVIKF